MEKLFIKSKVKVSMMADKIKKILKNKEGQGAVETAITILIAVVLGSLLLAGLYLLFKEIILPTLSTKIQEMFNYGG